MTNLIDTCVMPVTPNKAIPISGCGIDTPMKGTSIYAGIPHSVDKNTVLVFPCIVKKSFNGVEKTTGMNMVA